MAYSIEAGFPGCGPGEIRKPHRRFCRLVMGGATWSRSASTVIPASRLPAPPSKWPVIDFVELTSTTSPFAEGFADRTGLGAVAQRSRSRVSVQVADIRWAYASIVQRQLHHPAHASAILGRGVGVVRVAIRCVSHQFGKDGRAAVNEHGRNLPRPARPRPRPRRSRLGRHPMAGRRWRVIVARSRERAWKQTRQQTAE